MKGPRRFLTLILSVVVLAVLASVSLAGPGRFGRSNPWKDTVNAIEDDADEGTCVEPTDAPEPTDVPEPTDGEDCDAADADEETDGEATDPPADEAERETVCLEAAGLKPSQDDEDVEEDDVTKAHGLDNAIEHVIANCIKNPQSPGLLNALERLAANRERREAHEAWKAERKAERDAAKAERKAEKAATHGNGPDAEHGNPHDGTSGGSKGNSASHDKGNQ